MVLPVRMRIHWGSGRFCFCFFPRIFLILKDLLDGCARSKSFPGQCLAPARSRSFRVCLHPLPTRAPASFARSTARARGKTMPRNRLHHTPPSYPPPTRRSPTAAVPRPRERPARAIHPSPARARDARRDRSRPRRTAPMDATDPSVIVSRVARVVARTIVSGRVAKRRIDRAARRPRGRRRARACVALLGVFCALCVVFVAF